MRCVQFISVIGFRLTASTTKIASSFPTYRRHHLLSLPVIKGSFSPSVAHLASLAIASAPPTAAVRITIVRFSSFLSHFFTNPPSMTPSSTLFTCLSLATVPCIATWSILHQFIPCCGPAHCQCLLKILFLIHPLQSSCTYQSLATSLSNPSFTHALLATALCMITGMFYIIFSLLFH